MVQGALALLDAVIFSAEIIASAVLLVSVMQSYIGHIAGYIKQLGRGK